MATAATRKTAQTLTGTRSIRSTSKSGTAEGPPTTDQIADALASKLTITNTTSKTARRIRVPTKFAASVVEEDLSDEQKRVNAMQAVNAASQTLSGIVQSGWKKGAEGKDALSLANAIAAATASAKHLAVLRKVSPGDVDVERAAMSVLGKLASLEMYEAAYNALADLYPRLCVILEVTPSEDRKSFLYLLSLPIPSVSPTSGVILTLVSTYLAYSLSILTHPSSLPPSNAIAHDQLAAFISNSANSTILNWVPLLPSLPVKHIDAVLMRAYTAVTRFCSLTLFNSTPAQTKTTAKAKYSSISRNSKLPTEATPSAESLFNLRCYALSCLVHATITPNMFWDQATRSAAAFIRAVSPNDADAEVRATQLVLHRYANLAGRAEKRSDAASFISVDTQEGKGFISFCEYWMAFARRSGDICTLERIGYLMGSDSPRLSTKSSPINTPYAGDTDGDVKMAAAAKDTSKTTGSSKARDNNLVLKGARICASLTQTAAVLNVIVGKGKEKVNAGGIENKEFVRKLDESIALLNSSSSLTKLLVPFSNDLPGEMDRREAEELKRICGKVDRAFEKVRRLGNKVYESLSSSSNSQTEQEITLTIRNLLEVCVSSLQRTLLSAQSAITTSDIITRLLDTIFVLSRATLQVPDPRTYILSYEYLVQGKSTLERLYPDAATYAGLDVGNFVRCLSGAFHNMSGSLYQAGRYGHAIPFLRESCVLGGIALELRQRKEEAGTDQQKERKDTDVEGWKQLFEQLHRRWELLGVCYAKNGDRKSAFSSFKQCVYTFPYATLGTASQSDSMPANELFTSNSQIKQLVTIVDRVTYMGACELLLSPEEVSLRPSDSIPDSRTAGSSSHLTNDSLPLMAFYDPRIVGLLLECQLKALETSRWKEGIKPIYAKILKDLGATYRDAHGERMPIRRARVILKWIEFVYSTATGEDSEGIEGSIAEVEEVASEVKRLLSSEDLGIDVNLKTYIPQYNAMVDLWLALHTHKREKADQIALVITYVDQAYRTLKALLSSEGTSPRKSQDPKINLTASRRVVTSPKTRITRAQRVPSAPRKTAVKNCEPVTPKLRPKVAQVSKLIGPDPSSIIEADINFARSQLAFDTFSELLSLLQSVGSMLGLLSLMLPRARILSVTRKLCERHGGITSDGYVMASIDLAHEYVQLGKTKAAGVVFKQILASVRSEQCSDEVCTAFFLRFAEAMVSAEDVSESSSSYCKALSLSSMLDVEEKGMSAIQRVHTRVKRLEKAAMASHIFSMIQYCRNDVPIAFEAMLQSLRLWNRAMDTLHRLNPSVKPESQPEDDPFAIPDGSKSAATSSEQPAVAYRRPKEPFEWRISEGLLGTLFSLSQMYLNRGSPREAEYFAQQVQDLAENLNAPAALGRALAKKAEINLQLGKLEEGNAYLLRASEVLHDIPGIDIADIYRLKADYQERTEHFQDAELIYSRTSKMLEELNIALSQVDGPRKSLGLALPTVSDQKDTLVPHLLAAILRHYVWLLRQERDETFETALDQLLSLPHSSRTKIEENSLVAKLNLQDAYERCHGDMFLSSLAESTIALPMGTRNDGISTISTAARNILDLLDVVRRIYWENLDLTANKGNVWDMRESAILLSLVSVLEVSLGKPESDGGPMVVASLLDAASGITLRRELAEAVQHKFPVFSDDLKWPALGSDGAPIRQFHSNRLQLAQGRKSNSLDFSDDEADEGTLFSDESSSQGYWTSILQRYQGQSFDPIAFGSRSTYNLPANWTVIHINVTEDRNTLFLSRQEGGKKSKPSLIFRVPLQGRRDSGGEDEEERLTFQDATEELKDIIHLSNEGTKAAVHVKAGDEVARINWWKQRATLDTRLKELLENIEFCWLGAFKTILSSRPHLSVEVIENLRAQFEKVFQQCVQLKDKKAKPKTPSRKKTTSRTTAPAARVTLDDSLIECFSMLSPKCRDEELEDLLYFVLDLYQFHGIPVAIAEVDIAQAVVDLRSVLDEHAQKSSCETNSPSNDQKYEDEHIFLVLDKNLQGIPWESIPILRGRSVSRVPNLDFLQDRVQFSQWRQSQTPSSTTQQEKEDDKMESLVMNPRKGYFILNPSGDLSKTEERFRGWAEGMQKVGWEGTIGKPVGEQEFITALKTKDLVIYFGHGGGEQYVRSHKIRNLPSCAATMLWGCSSGALQDMGDFDRIGTPFNYILAGCPTLVANLWDVTDRDIDKFSQTVFDKMHLTPEDIRRPSSESNAISVVSAVSQSREACKLKYLTGAAPVIYGIPFYL